MAVLCFYILISILVVLSYCSVDHKSKTNNAIMDTLLTKRDVTKVQNLFAAHCAIKGEILNEIRETVKKQNDLIKNLVYSVASLNGKVAKQGSRTKHVFHMLKTQKDSLKALSFLMEKSVSGEMEISVNDTSLSCPADFLEFKENCYRYYETKKTWSEASDFCQASGGFLAEPRTEVETNFINSKVIEDRWTSIMIWLGGTKHGKIIADLSDWPWIDSDKEWIWASDGRVISDGFNNWIQPPTGVLKYNGDCMYITEKNKGWWPGHCVYEGYFICQTSKVSPL